MRAIILLCFVMPAIAFADVADEQTLALLSSRSAQALAQSATAARDSLLLADVCTTQIKSGYVPWGCLALAKRKGVKAEDARLLGLCLKAASGEESLSRLEVALKADGIPEVCRARLRERHKQLLYIMSAADVARPGT